MEAIGRREEDRGDCGSIQHAAHLPRFPLVAGRKGRTAEGIWGDPEWCKAVAAFSS